MNGKKIFRSFRQPNAFFFFLDRTNRFSLTEIRGPACIVALVGVSHMQPKDNGDSTGGLSSLSLSLLAGMKWAAAQEHAALSWAPSHLSKALLRTIGAVVTADPRAANFTTASASFLLWGVLFSMLMSRCTLAQRKDLTHIQTRARTHTLCHGVLSIARVVCTTSALISKTNYHGNKRREQRRLEDCGLEEPSCSKSGLWRVGGRKDG